MELVALWPVGSKVLTVDGSCIPCLVRLIHNCWTTGEALHNSFFCLFVFEELSWAVQWLGFHTSTAGGLEFDHWMGNEDAACHAVWLKNFFFINKHFKRRKNKEIFIKV